MGGISDDNIRQRAYQIWEREGRPHGRDFEHWVQAQVELTAEGAGNGATRKVVATRAAVKEKPFTGKAVDPPARARRGRKPA